jgi:hypothetical protein
MSEDGAEAGTQAPGRLRRLLRNPWLRLAALLALAGPVVFVAIDGNRALRRNKREAETRGRLELLRGRLQFYYKDQEGAYPVDALASLIPRYLDRIPEASVGPRHPEDATVHFGRAADDSGGWMYDNVFTDANFGTLQVNCTHTDLRGHAWNSY